MNRIIFLLLLLSWTACSRFLQKEDERVLARVYDDYLFESDVKAVIPSGTPPRDSLTLAKSYIDNWIRQRLMVNQALNNLSGSQMDFSRQLDDYKNSLIIYAYENELVKQKLDTVVSDEEIQSYYDGNPGRFLLRENVVRIRYVKLPAESKDKYRIWTLLRSSVPEDFDRLNDMCIKTGADYFLDDADWIAFSDLLIDIPLEAADQESFLKYRRDAEVRDSSFVYLVRFTDFRLKDDPAPVILVKDQIRDIILNKRKVSLLMKMQEDVYQSAIKNNNIEIY